MIFMRVGEMNTNRDSLEVKKERKDLYRFKNAKIMKSRLHLIKKLIKDKTVLDIGSVQHISSFESNTNFRKEKGFISFKNYISGAIIIPLSSD